MRKRLVVIGLAAIVACVFGGAGTSVFAAELDLVVLLTKNLGVTDAQAEGGAGAIFDAASKNMSVDDFTKVTDALPEVKSLMNSLSSSASGSGTLGGLSSMLGKSDSSLSFLAGSRQLI